MAIASEEERNSKNPLVRLLVRHWTLDPIVKPAAEEEREKYLFLYWRAIPFNRWMLFASSFLIQFCCGSLYSWSNFNNPIDILIYGTKTANKAPNTFYIAVGMFGLTAMLMGPWLERHGPRRGLVLGSCMFGVGQAIASLSLYKKSIVGVYIGYGVLGGFGLGLNYISPVSALQKFFPDYRGVASGFAVAGFGAGAIVWSKVYIPLMDRYKLPETFAILGALLTGTMLASTIVIRTPPNNFTAGGLSVSGEKVYKDDPNKLQFEEPSANHPTHANIPSEHHVVAGTSSTPIVMTLIQSIFSIDFGFMYLMFFANQLFGLVALSRLATMAEDLFGKSANQASTVVSINGVFNCLGRLALPMSADLAIRNLRVNPPFARKVIFYVSLVTQIIIVAILPHLINRHNYNGFRAVMWILTFFYGGGFGTIPCFLTDMFGPYNIGALHGMILTAWSIGGVGGGLGFTHLFDKHKPSAARANVAGAYNEAYESNLKWILAVLIVGFVMTFFVRTDQVDRTSPGWRYSIFGKQIVHFKEQEMRNAPVSEDVPLLLRGEERTRQAVANGTALYRPNPGSQASEMQSQAHRPLTLYRRLRGLVCLIILLSTAFVALVILAPFAFFILRLFSVHYSRYWTSFFMGRWLSMWPYLFETVNETRVIFSGDKVPPEDRVMLMCNHRTEVDWMYLWNLALRKGRIGYCKYAVKSSVKNLPLFGWAFYVFEFLMLDRRWEVDAPVIKKYLDSFQDPRDPIWLVVFPEGTDFTEAKRDKGNKYAKEKGHPELVNVLQPRTRGFVACLSELRGSLDAVYDLTIGYKNQCPLFINNLYGTDPAEVHMHICRIPLSEIPESEEDMSQWLYEVFYKKDQMLASFSQEGSFPNSGNIEKPLNIAEGLCTLILFLGSSLWVYWWLISSLWLRIYVVVICLVLAFGTYFDWRPSPIFYTRLRTKRKRV